MNNSIIPKWDLRNTTSQILATMAKNLLMSTCGMILGFPTILIGGLVSKNSDEFVGITDENISWIGSISLLFITIGCLLSGLATQTLGPKRSMQCTTIPFVICWIGFYFSTEVWQLNLALVCMGLFEGLAEGPLCTYVSEISEPHLRGILNSSASIFGMLGIFVQFTLGAFFSWRTCALISATVPIATFISFCFVPESPYWLILNHKVAEAKQSLAWLRGWTTIENVESKVQEILESSNQKPEKFSWLSTIRLLFRKNFIWPFGLTTFLFFLGQFSGGATLQTYAISIFATLNVPMNTYYATAFLGASEIIGATIGTCVIHILGKRKLLFVTLSALCVSNLTVAIYAHLNDIKYISLVNENDLSNDFENANWFVLTFMLLISTFTNGGIYFLPWILISEFYSHETRSIGCGISGATSYLLSFISNKLYLTITSGITLFGTYVLYGSFCFIGIVTMYFALPETEGKSLVEINNHFAGISKLDNNIKKKETRTTNSGEVNVQFEDDDEEVKTCKL